jgi:hypothetical protein
MNRNPEVDRWLDEAGHPLDATKRSAREIILGTMRFGDLEELEAGRSDFENAVRAWCEWKAG